MSRPSVVWPRKLVFVSLLLAAGCATGEELARVEPMTTVDSGLTGAGAGGDPPSSGGTSGGGGSVDVTGAGGSSGSTGGAGGTTTGGLGASGGASGSAFDGGSNILFVDDFQDGDLTKPSWIDPNPSLKGMWSIATVDGTNKVLTQSAAVSDWIISVSGDYRWTDQVVEAKVKFTSAPGDAGIFARVQDTRNYYYLYLDGSNIVLRKRINNSSSDIKKVKHPSVMGTWYTLKLSVIGTALIGYVDEAMLVNGTDSGVPGGGIALGSSDASAQFDDVTVTKP